MNGGTFWGLNALLMISETAGGALLCLYQALTHTVRQEQDPRTSRNP